MKTLEICINASVDAKTRIIKEQFNDDKINYKFLGNNAIVFGNRIVKNYIYISDNNIVFKLSNLSKRKYSNIVTAILNQMYRENSSVNRKKLLSSINLCKQYKGNNFFSLKNINININRGEIVGLLGHNGAGKSTFIKSVVGQEEITSGNVEFLGIDSQKFPSIFKANLGYIPDHYILFDNLTGREYVNYIADLYNVEISSRRKQINHLLRLFELSNSFDAKIGTYSFGMKQKITIISSLICQPKVWLLDEPLTGLDPDSIVQIKKCIKEHAEKGNAVLFSSHLIDVVEELATRIIILNNGEVIYDKSKDESLKKYNNDLNKLYIDKVGGRN